MIARIKYFFIVALAICAVYQTVTLWFNNIQNRNFFYDYIAGWFEPSEHDPRNGIATPYRVTENFGGNRMHVSYGFQEQEVIAYFEAAMTETLRGGSFQMSYPVDYNYLFSERSYIFQYAFTMTSEAFSRAFNQNANALVSRGLTNFDAVIIYPSSGANEYVRVIFLDGDTAYLYLLKNDKLPGITLPNHSGLTYVSAALLGLPITHDMIIARLPEGETALNSVTAVNPYENAYGEKQLVTIQRRVEGFFDNPSLVSAGLSQGGVFTFRDDLTVVRYYENDTLEYVSYKTTGREAVSSLGSNYAAAVKFIAADLFVTNEYYLADYSYEENRHVFYFNYTVNNLPLLSPNGSCAIEVTVDHGIVSRYLKAVGTYAIDGDAYINVKISTDTLIGRLRGHNNRVTLAYAVNPSGEVRLSWIVGNISGIQIIEAE
ncbi:MAG: hypothetical protein FWE82_08865 [Defluviitaleaceae bacterium]|nr:hypothetical protein [Defluviitaleaceae bacterium]